MIHQDRAETDVKKKKYDPKLGTCETEPLRNTLLLYGEDLVPLARWWEEAPKTSLTNLQIMSVLCVWGGDWAYKGVSGGGVGIPMTRFPVAQLVALGGTMGKG